ncbi:7960_t:CDS:2, partial [Funneliformis geosporum]
SIMIDVLSFNDVSEDEFNLKSSQEVLKEHVNLSPAESEISNHFEEFNNIIMDLHDLSLKGWDEAVNKLHFSETDTKLLKNVKKLMKLTLPKFLRDVSTLVKPHII